IGSAISLDFSNWLTVFLKAALAKSGVPLLSLISGYLAIYSLEKYGYFKLLVNKAKRLLWPLFWVLNSSVFTFTFFNKMYFHYFAVPEFFKLSGSLFVTFILLSAMSVSIALNLLWFKVIAPGLLAMWGSLFSQSEA
ncbi:MAG: hypothetical protein V3S21_07360, partial [Xanthomonadales bacterium]